MLNKKIFSLQSEINHLKNQVHKCKCQVPKQKKLLIDDSETLFYNGLELRPMNYLILLPPVVKKRYHCYK